jgi:D-cysteine desulfhydrase
MFDSPKIPRAALGFFPTPVTELKRLSTHLGGPRIFMKRDDQTGVALGGNKVRKLEFLLGDALSKGADTIITGGAAQSNHCRQTAGAAAASGLQCHLALGGEEAGHYQGNLLLDKLLGAQLHWCGENRKGEQIPDIAEELSLSGRKPYIVPYGGSNRIGAVGFVAAMGELAEQQQGSTPPFSHIVFASSSGGTHAGIVLGNAWYNIASTCIGIGIDKEDMAGPGLDEYVLDLVHETAELLEYHAPLTREAIILSQDYFGAGYGVLGEPEREAIALAARQEGILLDPVYTGRAMAGLIDMIRKGDLGPGDSVLFWHTGGTPALFAYGDALF